MNNKESGAENKTQNNPNQFANMKSWFEIWEKFRDEISGFDSAKTPATFYSSCFKVYDDMARNVLAMPANNALGDSYQRFAGAADVYSKLLESWTKILMSGEKQFSPEIFKDLLNAWLASQREIFSRLFGMPLPILPAEITNFEDWAKSIKQSMEDWSDLYRSGYTPSLEAWQKFSDNANKMMNPNIASVKYKEFYDSWMAGYESTLGKVMKIPMIGPSRRVLEMMKSSLDAFIKFSGASADFYLALYKPSVVAVEELTAEASKILQCEFTPEKYREFYSLLIKTFEAKFYELFRSPEFGEVLKTTLNAALDFRRYHFAVMEEILKSTPIITRSEMDEVYQELYTLRKRIKSLEKNNNTK